MTWVVPPHVCEKEDYHLWPNGLPDDAKDEDCVFASGLMQYLALHPGAAPATLYEAERIRQDAGLPPIGGANSDDLIRGTTKRYGWAPTKIPPGFAVLWSSLRPGMGATASGKPADCPSTSPFRRFLQTYTGGHRVFIERLDATDRVWLMDPEGPLTGYSGQWATKDQLAVFVKNGSSHTVAPLAEVGEVLPISDTTAKVVTAKAGAIYYDPGTGAQVTKESLAQRVVPSHYASGGYRLVSIPTGGTVKLLGVKPTDTNVSITDAPAPVVPKPLAAGVYKVG